MFYLYLSEFLYFLITQDYYNWSSNKYINTVNKINYYGVQRANKVLSSQNILIKRKTLSSLLQAERGTLNWIASLLLILIVKGLIYTDSPSPTSTLVFRFFFIKLLSNLCKKKFWNERSQNTQVALWALLVFMGSSKNQSVHLFV